MDDKPTVGKIEQLTNGATKQYTDLGLLPNLAGQQELKVIKLNEQIKSLQDQLDTARGEVKRYESGIEAALLKMNNMSDDARWSSHYRLGVAFSIQSLEEQLQTDKEVWTQDQIDKVNADSELMLAKFKSLPQADD